MRVLEIVRDLRHLRLALAGPAAVDPRERVELECEIDDLEWRLDALRRGLPEDFDLVERQAMEIFG
jgi:hypothetical protein